jgi:hypothetical protein
MKAEHVVSHFVAMCYDKRLGTAASGNWRAIRTESGPSLTLFGNTIAWLKPSWGDTDDIIDTSNCGWNTRTTNKGLKWVERYRRYARHNRQQKDIFDETE